MNQPYTHTQANHTSPPTSHSAQRVGSTALFLSPGSFIMPRSTSFPIFLLLPFFFVTSHWCRPMIFAAAADDAPTAGAALSTQVVHPLPFSFCGPDHLGIHSIFLNQWPIKPGGDILITGKVKTFSIHIHTHHSFLIPHFLSRTQIFCSQLHSSSDRDRRQGPCHRPCARLPSD